MYSVLFVPGQSPQPVLALGVLAANTRRAYNDPVNLAAAAGALGVNSACNLTWSHSFSAYVQGQVWGDGDEQERRNLVAERVLNELQYGVSFGTIDTQLFGPVLICFDTQARGEIVITKTLGKV